MRPSSLGVVVFLGLMATLSGCKNCDCIKSWRRPAEDRGRAGYPDEISACAQPSDDGAYCGYHVGGGAACKGEAPCIDDGTWGWDYQGCIIPANVILNWWHGERHQGGNDGYKIDGPRIAESIKERHD